jgi:hypothetical protein
MLYNVVVIFICRIVFQVLLVLGVDHVCVTKNTFMHLGSEGSVVLIRCAAQLWCSICTLLACSSLLLV